MDCALFGSVFILKRILSRQQIVVLSRSTRDSLPEKLSLFNLQYLAFTGGCTGG